MNLKIEMYFDIFLNEVLEYTTGNKMMNVTVLYVYQTLGTRVCIVACCFVCPRKRIFDFQW